MQLIPNGPDVPDRLLQAHEEGEVVFFCGAGISRAAGLPDFAALAEDLCGSFPEDPQVGAALDARQYDTAIGLLELKVPREKVRAKVADLLRVPDAPDEGALACHPGAPGSCEDPGREAAPGHHKLRPLV